VENPIVDDAGRRLFLAGAPQRIVSLVPSLTEVVCALGAAARLVGVTRYCTDPAAIVAGLPRVGGTKNPDLARIVALEPDLVLLNTEENRKEDFDRLLAAGLAVFVSFPRTVNAAADSIERIGTALECERAGRAAAEEIRAAARAGAGGARRRRVFCPIWRNPWMSFNADTYAHDLLSRAGGDNVCAGAPERYPKVELEAVVAAAPEVILLPDEPYVFRARHRAELRAASDDPAWRAVPIHLVDGKALSWYGPRTAPALRYFRERIGSSR
jgi:ABC-type Fe3+-hydroxamate transport system substrate-binding protein